MPESQACNFIKKDALALVFSCEFCETFKNTFFTEQESYGRLLFFRVGQGSKYASGIVILTWKF